MSLFKDDLAEHYLNKSMQLSMEKEGLKIDKENLLKDIESLLEHILLNKKFTNKDFEYCLNAYPEIITKITNKKVFLKEEN